MLDTLLQALINARAINRLSFFLAAQKEEKGLSKRELRTTGTVEEVCDGARRAVEDGHISILELAELVDELEENGAQHLFLFRLADREGIPALTKNMQKFPAKPVQPTEALYAALPATNRLFFESRDGAHVIKFVGKTSYWMLESDDFEDENTQVIVRKRRERRSVHLLKVNENSGLIEVRIAHAGVEAPDKQWETDLDEFLTRLGDALELTELEPVPIWRGFARQVQNRDETFMSVDEARDSVTNQRISMRRRVAGGDVRDYPDYRLHEERFVRDALRIYWVVDFGDEEGKLIHTIQQKSTIGDGDGQKTVGKVWVTKRVTARELDYVLARIRAHAR